MREKFKSLVNNINILTQGVAALYNNGINKLITKGWLKTMDGQKFLKIVLIFIALVAGKLFSQHFITGTHYKTFKSNDGGYSVTIPTTNKSDVQKLNTPAGPIDVFFQLARDRNLGIEFGVSHFTLPEALKSRMQNGGENVFFENTINGMIKDNAGKIVSKQNIKFKNYPGCECEIRTADDKYIKVKLFIVKNMSYQILVNCYPQDRNHKKVREFFNSFELTNI